MAASIGPSRGGWLKNPAEATQCPAMSRRVLLSMLLGALAVAGVVVVGFGGTERTDLVVALDGWEERLEDCLRQEPEDFAGKCVQDLADRAGRQGDIGSGLAILRAGSSRNQTLTGKCHNATHALGQQAVARGVTLQEAYAVDFADCRFGFYHGALEAHTANLDLASLSAELPTLCASFGDETSAATGECVHVLGHFVFDRTKPDIERGLTVCARLGSSRLQGRCVDGLLMQGVDLVRAAVGDPKHERRGLLVDVWGEGVDEQEMRVRGICDAVSDGTVVYTCYTNASQALAVLWSFDYPAVHRFCESVDEQWRRPCFEGIAASGFTGLDWDVEAIAGACHAGDSADTRYCIETLSFTFALQGSREQRELVCSFARDYEMASCREGIERGLGIRSELAGDVTGGEGSDLSPGSGDYDIYSE
jgi:hypothetical protein